MHIHIVCVIIIYQLFIHTLLYKHIAAVDIWNIYKLMLTIFTYLLNLSNTKLFKMLIFIIYFKIIEIEER